MTHFSDSEICDWKHTHFSDSEICDWKHTHFSDSEICDWKHTHFSDSEICELNLIADIAGTYGNLPALSNIHCNSFTSSRRNNPEK